MKTSYFEQLIAPQHLHELKFLASDKNYTILNFLSGITKKSAYTLLNFEKMLSKDESFVRIHKSYIVNLNYIKTIDFNASYLKLKDDSVLPMSKIYIDYLDEILSFNQSAI